MLKKITVSFLLLVVASFNTTSLSYSQSDSVPPQVETTVDLLDFNQIEIADVLKLMSQKIKRNIIATQNVKGRVTIYLKNIGVLDSLRVIMDAYGWAFIDEGNIIKVMTAQEYEEKTGQKFGLSFKTRVYTLNFGGAGAIAALLNQIKSSSGKVISDDKSGTLVLMDGPEKLAQMDEVVKRMDVERKTEVFNLSYAKAKDLAGEITQLLTPSTGVVKFDDRTNRIVVTDTPKILDNVRDIVKAFDVKHKEVLIQARIVQVILDDSHKMGVSWSSVLRKFNKMSVKSNFDVLNSADKSGRVAVGSLEDDDFQVMIEALDSVGKTRILSSPRITALNNEEAKILVGSTKPYVTTTTTTPSSGPVTTAESVNFIDVGVKLYVTPSIHEDGFITVKIKPEVSSATGTVTTGTNNTIPIVDTSEAETKVMVKDGVTIILGGLIKEEELKSEQRVPFLGRIPILKAAFSRQSNSLTKTEIAIFIKPTIITGDVNQTELSNLAEK